MHQKKDLLLNLIITSTFTIMATLKGRVPSPIGFSRKLSTPSACLASLEYLSLVDTSLKNAMGDFKILHDGASCDQQ